MPYTSKEALACRNDFPALSRTVNGFPLAYLDGPGGTQVPNQVIEAVSDYYRRCNANTHGAFITSSETDEVMDRARDSMAAFMGAESAAQVSFGANMTSLNFALSHALVRKMSPGDEILITELDHEANRGPWLKLAERGMVIKEVRVTEGGTLDRDDLAAKIGPRTRVVAMGMASNALGTVSLEEIALARKLSRDVGAWLVLDAVHYAPHFPLDVQALDTDFLLCSAYKFYGPHVGILYAHPGLLDQLDTDRLCTQDGAAPWRIETGTLNHAAIAGVTAAVDYVAGLGSGNSLRERILSAKSDIADYEYGLATRYWSGLAEIPGVRAWGPDFSSRKRSPTVSITMDALNSDALAAELAKEGHLVWDGNFYAHKVVSLLGLDERGGLLRTGFSMYNTSEEVDRLLQSIRTLSRQEKGWPE
ncbi:MAG: cysteine desulfurase-like protein [Gammaproteobacteria bacterium]|nr:cysteine desulfurase-like protein [Gammaproteobacteria bacterium]